MGANAHGKISEYIEQLNLNTIFVEVGISPDPAPNCSTHELFNIADSYGFPMYSIDISELRLRDLSYKIPEMYANPNYNIIIDEAENFLKDIKKYDDRKISFAYLDGFDWMYNPEEYWKYKTPEWQHQQYLDYQKSGVELTNTNSAVSHLRQTILVEELSDEKAIILYDDTWFWTGADVYIGKGCASIYYLLSKGWDLLPFTRDDLPSGQNAIMLGKNIIPNKKGTIH